MKLYFLSLRILSPCIPKSNASVENLRLSLHFFLMLICVFLLLLWWWLLLLLWIAMYCFQKAFVKYVLLKFQREIKGERKKSLRERNIDLLPPEPTNWARALAWNGTGDFSVHRMMLTKSATLARAVISCLPLKSMVDSELQRKFFVSS